MPLISTKLHGAGDYATGLLLIAAPRFLPIRDRRAQALAVGTGGSVLLASAMTDYELGLRRKLPMTAHLLLDALTGGLLVAGAIGLRERRGSHVADWLPHALVGLGEVTGAALTERTPSDRRGSSGDGGSSSDGPAASFSQQAPTGVSGQGIAAQAPAATGAPLAPPPLETPGPSVTPPAQPESDVERAERIDAVMAGADAPQTGETLVAQQEAAAAAEAAAIGGVLPGATDDPAMDPVFQAGGGEQDGWEAAEADLIENATHGEGHGQPERNAFSPEVESDRSTAVYGEGDRISSTEVEDPAPDAQDPGTHRG